MAGFNKELEFSENHKSSTFNRSFTMYSTSSTEFPSKPSLERANSIKSLYNSSFESVKGKVRQLCSLFEKRPILSPQLPPPKPPNSPPPLTSKKPEKAMDSYSALLPGTEDRVVVYLTSLRGIRRTYEDCYAVRMILRGFRINVDERDVSMDSGYRKELQSVLGEQNVVLPQVFVKGKYVGGADVVKGLHEIGELGRMVKGLPVRAVGHVCDGCGDVRFVPCTNCNGSRKVFDEDDEQLKRCLECNENGLIRCPTCCS